MTGEAVFGGDATALGGETFGGDAIEAFGGVVVATLGVGTVLGGDTLGGSTVFGGEIFATTVTGGEIGSIGGEITFGGEATLITNGTFLGNSALGSRL